jgi:hypothetical protein
VPISPEKAHERAKKAAEGRKNPDHLIAALADAEAAGKLTPAHGRKLAVLALSRSLTEDDLRELARLVRGIHERGVRRQQEEARAKAGDHDDAA